MSRIVHVVGRIWDPGAGQCVTSYPLPRDVRGSRKAVAAFLKSQSTDFRAIDDFCVVRTIVQCRTVVPWKDEAHEALLDG